MDFIFYIHRWLFAPFYRILRRLIPYNEILGNAHTIDDYDTQKLLTTYLNRQPNFIKYAQKCRMLLIYSPNEEYWEILYIQDCKKFISNDICDIQLNLDPEQIYELKINDVTLSSAERTKAIAGEA